MTAPCFCTGLTHRVKRHIKGCFTKSNFEFVVLGNDESGGCGCYFNCILPKFFENYEEQKSLFRGFQVDNAIWEWSILKMKVYAVPMYACSCCYSNHRSYAFHNGFAKKYKKDFFGDVALFKTKKKAEEFIKAYENVEY